MPTRSLQPAIPTILAVICGAPILFAFLLASLPVLIPILAYRWLSRKAEAAGDAAIPVAQLAA